MKYEELISLLKMSEHVEEIDKHREEILKLIPQIWIMLDYDQKNDAHQFDLWMHSLHTVINLPDDVEDDMLYLAALVHDIGKPPCQVAGTKEDDTNMHYYGHPDKSAEIVEREIVPILNKDREHISKEEQRRLFYYVKYHDDHVSLRLKHLKRHLKIASLIEFQNLMKLEAADAKAHVQIPIIKQRVEICEKSSGQYANELYERFMKEKNEEYSNSDELIADKITLSNEIYTVWEVGE